MIKFVTILLACASITLGAEIARHDANGYWIITDYIFAGKYDLMNVVNLMNVESTSLNTVISQHEMESVGVQAWCPTAGSIYSANAFLQVATVQSFALQKGYPNLVAYLNPLATTANDAGRELQKVADTITKETADYNKQMNEGVNKQKNRFNDNAQDSFSKIADGAKDKDDAKCINKALRTISKVVETHHTGTGKHIKGASSDPSSIFAFVETLKLLNDDFNTRITNVCRQCIDDGWLNGSDDDTVKECLDKVIDIKGKEIIDSDGLSEKAKTSVTYSLTSTTGKASEMTDTESAKLVSAVKDMESCLGQTTTTTTTTTTTEAAKNFYKLNLY